MSSNDVSGRLLIGGLKMVPKNAVSRVMGNVAALPLPGPVQRAELKLFGALAGVDFDEVKAPLSSFRSLQDFFIRELKEGARPVDAADDAFVSPCDGAWGQSGKVVDGCLVQVKGKPYRLSTLLGDDALAARFEGGAFATIYLSPRDYHRFHVPCDVRVTEAVHLPGHLWPVNAAGVQHVDGLFAVNERIVAVFERPEDPTAKLAMVAVGATMVGKVNVTFDTLTTNEPGVHSPRRKQYGESGKLFKKGDEWGHFKFGSTIVFAATPGWLELDAGPLGTPLRLGERIGTLAQNAEKDT